MVKRNVANKNSVKKAAKRAVRFQNQDVQIRADRRQGVSRGRAAAESVLAPSRSRARVARQADADRLTGRAGEIRGTSTSTSRAAQRARSTEGAARESQSHSLRPSTRRSSATASVTAEMKKQREKQAKKNIKGSSSRKSRKIAREMAKKGK